MDVAVELVGRGVKDALGASLRGGAGRGVRGGELGFLLRGKKTDATRAVTENTECAHGARPAVEREARYAAPHEGAPVTAH